MGVASGNPEAESRVRAQPGALTRAGSPSAPLVTFLGEASATAGMEECLSLGLRRLRAWGGDRPCFFLTSQVWHYFPAPEPRSLPFTPLPSQGEPTACFSTFRIERWQRLCVTQVISLLPGSSQCSRPPSSSHPRAGLYLFSFAQPQNCGFLFMVILPSFTDASKFLDLLRHRFQFFSAVCG